MGKKKRPEEKAIRAVENKLMIVPII